VTFNLHMCNFLFFWKEIRISIDYMLLTPKGPLVPTGDKPVLGSVVCSHNIFRILEFFFPSNASRNKLRVSTNFMILGATDQKL
jgi:hypothetical protein